MGVQMEWSKPMPENSASSSTKGPDALCRIALARMQPLWPFACRLGESLQKYEDADDLWQDVTVRLWRKISAGELDPALVDSPQFAAYARRALMRRYLEIVRFHSMQKRDQHREVTIEDLHDSVPGADATRGAPLEAQFSDQEALMLALSQLPDEWRIVIQGKYLEGKTLKEAGEEAGLSPSAISKGLGKRLTQLRTILQRYESESRSV